MPTGPTAKMAVLRSPQGETIVVGFPQSQPHEALLKRTIELRPKRAYNILTGGRLVAKFVGFKIEVFVAPRGERPTQSVA
jgi:hypothetical protein